MKLWHYTSTMHLEERIVSAGHLALTDSILGLEVREPGVVWFMNHPNPHLVRGNKMLKSSVDKTEIRLAVDLPDAVQWIKWAKQQEGFDPIWAAAMNQAGNFTMLNWYISLREVPLAEVVSIEEWNGMTKYVPYPRKVV